MKGYCSPNVTAALAAAVARVEAAAVAAIAVARVEAAAVAAAAVAVAVVERAVVADCLRFDNFSFKSYERPKYASLYKNLSHLKYVCPGSSQRPTHE